MAAASGRRSWVGARTSTRRGASVRTRAAPVAPPAHPTYSLAAAVAAALEEDAGGVGDITSLATIPAGTQARATLLAKADGVLAGRLVAEEVLRQVDPAVACEWSKQDGDLVAKGERFAVFRGEARSILTAERVVLNFMQRMSGIATATAAMADAAQPARILETRKTAPGLRLVDKWAVLIGGGENHRMGLFDMVLIKDNHVAAAGGITAAVERARAYVLEQGLDAEIEVETRTLAEVEEAAECCRNPANVGAGRVRRVMLDNMSLDDMRTAVGILDGLAETEASGNVTLETVNAIGATGVTFISSGALTHSVTALDISLNVENE